MQGLQVSLHTFPKKVMRERQGIQDTVDSTQQSSQERPKRPTVVTSHWSRRKSM